MGLFREEYRELSDEEKQLIADIKAKATELEALVSKAVEMNGVTRYSALALTHLEQAVMWIVKHITG